MTYNVFSGTLNLTQLLNSTALDTLHSDDLAFVQCGYCVTASNSLQRNQCS